MNKKISDKDKKDWDNFLSNKEKLKDKDLTFEKKKKYMIHGFFQEIQNLQTLTGS